MGERNTDYDGLLEKWNDSALERQRAHTRAAVLLYLAHYLVGVPVVALTAVSGTAALTAVASKSGIPTFVAVLSLVATALSALQTFLGPQARAEVHRVAAVGYAVARREMDVLLTENLPDDEFRRRRDALKQNLDDVLMKAPTVMLVGRDFDYVSVRNARSMRGFQLEKSNDD
jgi:hypothetical protein